MKLEPKNAARGSFALLAFALALLVGSLGFTLVQRARARTALDHRLSAAAGEQVESLENYFERARSIVLLTATNPAFAEFYAAPGGREQEILRGGPEVRKVNDALAYLESLYPTSIGEACFIHVTGPENARVVRGVRALPPDLSPDESANPFFAPTFALDVGQVYQAEPYVSPDTGEWVISNSTLVPFAEGEKRAIVHFEVTVESFRRAASTSSDVSVVVVDGQGRVVFDSGFPQQIGSPLGRPEDHRFGSIPLMDEPEGMVDASGARAAFARLPDQAGNANDWTVIVTPSPGSALAHSESISWPPVLAALGLLLGAAWNHLRVSRALRRQRERLAQQEQALRSAQQQRGKLLNALVSATEDERKRVARELHDGPIQQLTSIDIELEMLRDDAGTQETSLAVEAVQGRLRAEITDLRRLMARLRPPALDERGLPHALADYGRLVTQPAGIDFTFTSEVDGRLSPTTETVLYRVAQEALANVIKHARADRVEISLGRDNGAVKLEVRDDGVGFEPARQDEFVQEGHFGLVGMRERVELAGGSWHLTSDPGCGTSIRAVVPR